MIYVKNNNLKPDKDEVLDIAGTFSFSELTSRFLLSRGYSKSDIASLLDDGTYEIVPHYDIPNIELAAERIEEAMMTGEKIAVFGDYDADGICGTSIIVNSFKSFGYDDVIYYIPNRISEGYGLNNDAIDIIAEQGCSLIVTVDCGISNANEIAYANEIGIEVIVTDHHIPGESIPDAIVVNPQLSEDENMRRLCGAMVALKLMCVLFDDGIYYESCDLAAIATIADMVEIKGENKTVVKMGLKKINEQSNKYISYLVQECITNKKTIKADDIAFFVAPAINAAGRLDEADKCVELFTGRSAMPKETAAILAHDNYNRKKIEKETYDSALEKIRKMDLSLTKAIILFDENWHQGVLGIAASKIKNKFFRPVILFSENDGALVGSARSIEGVNIHSAIDYCAEYVSHFGGHYMAAGLSLEKDKFEGFKAAFEEYLKQFENEVFKPALHYDVEAFTNEIDIRFINELELFEPFGKDNPAPSVLLKGLDISDYQPMGSEMNHFRCRLSNDKNPIASVSFFDKLQIYDAIKYDALVSPQKNEWNGRASVQCVINEIRPSVDKTDWNLLAGNLAGEFDVSFSQGLYSGSSSDKIKSDFDVLEAMLEESAFSTLLLCPDMEGFLKFKEKMSEQFAAIDIRFGQIEEGKINYNTLVIAPDFERVNLCGYNNIFLISAFDISKMFNSLKLDGKMYIISDYKKHVRKFELGIDRLRQIYIEIRRSILNKTINKLLNGESEFKLWETRAALKIFEEAGLVQYSISEDKFMLTDKKKTDLQQCPTFLNLQAGE